MLQVQFREKTKDALAKNIKITSAHLTTEEIDEKLDKGDISVFSSAIIQVRSAQFGSSNQINLFSSAGDCGS